MNSSRFARKALLFSVILTLGLFISLRILQARNREAPVPSIDKIAEDAVLHGDLTVEDHPARNGNERLLAMMNKKNTADNFLVPFSSPQTRPFLLKMKHRGTPFLYLSCGRVYGINEDGEILGTAEELPRAEVPVVTGTALKFHVKKGCLAGEEFEQLVQFVQLVEDANSLLYSRISEINISQEIGMIAYVNWLQMMPIIVGRNDLEVKVHNLDVFFSQLGNSELAEKTRYLDVRIDGKIILKKLNG
jgi:hypothetical protein